jgi:hypothetical protein
MSMGWEDVFELQPPTGLLFIHHTIYEYGEPRWNNIVGGEPNNSERNLSQCHFVRHKFHTARTRASAVRGRRLTAWSMARPFIILNLIQSELYFRYCLITRLLVTTTWCTAAENFAITFGMQWGGGVQSIQVDGRLPIGQFGLQCNSLVHFFLAGRMFSRWIVTNITSTRVTLHCSKACVPCGGQLVICGL